LKAFNGAHLCDIQRSGDGCSDTSGYTSSCDVGDWTVTSIGIKDAFEEFVCGELNSGEWDSHGDGRRIGDVESGQALCTIDRSGAGHDGTMRGIADLHALLDDCEA
jgi:hypothetical protein